MSSRSWDILAFISSNKICKLPVTALQIPSISLCFCLKSCPLWKFLHIDYGVLRVAGLFKLATMSPSGWHPPNVGNTDTLYLGDQRWRHQHWPVSGRPTVLDFLDQPSFFLCLSVCLSVCLSIFYSYFDLN